MTEHNAAQVTQVSSKTGLPVEVQQAVLRLLAFNARYRLVDGGYDVHADLRLVLDQFEIVVKGPIAPNPGNTPDNEV
jgi:hypothetical protein